MGKIKILVVEDELLTATDIEEKLTCIGYEVVGIAQTSEDAVRLVKSKSPDLIILDIQIAGEKDGIETARLILEDWHGPIIFLTAFSHKEVVEKAKNLFPAAYLLKPFNIAQFAIHLEMAISNFLNQRAAITSKTQRALPNSIFISVNQVYQKIEKSDILFIEAAGSYITIQAKDQKFMVSTNLKNLEKQLDDPQFTRVHRKYVVNLNHIERFDSSSVYLNNLIEQIPIGEMYRQNITSQLLIIKTK